MNHMILGEYHTGPDRERCEQIIYTEEDYGSFKFILSEELGPHRYYTNAEMIQAQKDKMYSISDRSLKLARHLNIPAIGIDNWDDATYAQDQKNPDGTYKNCINSFRIREATMLKVIREFMAKGRVAVLIGDSHLRETSNPVMGRPSVIWTTLKDRKDVSIIRSPHAEVK